MLEDIVEELASIRTRDKSIRKRLGEVSGHLGEWLKRERANRALFSHLLQEENRERQQRSRARPLIEEVKKQVSVLMRGIEIRTNDIDRNLRLPRATFAEWSGIFQNAFLNAANAMLDSIVDFGAYRIEDPLGHRPHGARLLCDAGGTTRPGEV